MPVRKSLHQARATNKPTTLLRKSKSVGQLRRKVTVRAVKGLTRAIAKGQPPIDPPAKTRKEAAARIKAVRSTNKGRRNLREAAKRGIQNQVATLKSIATKKSLQRAAKSQLRATR